MKAPVLGFLVAVWCGAGCGQKSTPQSADPTNAPSASGNPLTAPVDYVGAVGRAAQHSAKVVDTVQVQQAIRQFQAGEDRYPKDLEELVREGYLPALPKLPAGMKYEYNPANGQVRAVRPP